MEIYSLAATLRALFMVPTTEMYLFAYLGMISLPIEGVVDLIMSCTVRSCFVTDFIVECNLSSFLSFTIITETGMLIDSKDNQKINSKAVQTANRSKNI